MKICKLCGEDCSQRPRVKDAAGSYYCKTCHGAAMEQREEREAVALGQADAGFNDAGVNDDEYGVLSEILADAPVAPPPGRQCAGCGAGVAVDAHVCTNCGMNLDSGKKMKVHVMRGGASSDGGQVWPIVIGILCILIGGGDMTIRVIDMLPSDDPFLTGSTGAGFQVGNVVGILFAIWLLVAGIGVLRRTQAGAASLLKWAKVRTIIGATCFALLLGATAISYNSLQGMSSELGSVEESALMTVIMVTLVIAFLLNLAWPIFLWVFLTRSGIENQISQWD